LGVLAAVLVLAGGAYIVVFGLVRSVPSAVLAPVPRASAFPNRPLALAWPPQGQAALGVEGVGLLGVHDSQKPIPIASVAKMMTAYIVLRDHPLVTAAGGPEITVTPGDLAVYRADAAAGQSVVPVRAGERLSERQALEGLLLPSGNNLATLLARWDAGSQTAFVDKMNAQARSLDLAHTRYIDASGLSPGTTSTARDQVSLAMLAFEVPVLRQIVAMRQATLPVAGRQYNLNAMLGKDGIVGVKTGSTSQAGGCFVFAAHERINGKSVIVVGAVLHQMPGRAHPSAIAQAFRASATLLGAARKALTTREVVRRGATLATVGVPWARFVTVQAARSAELLGWGSLPIKTTVGPAPALALPLKAGQRIATATITAGRQSAEVPLIVSQALPQASLGWRLTHP
jgi:serine-type D-Ala-D-Ala carboxypeptidase (penicillin-binding protein 5/6)